MCDKNRKRFVLLTVLNTLLEEQSVTLTAEKMNLSIPSVSRLLSDIRREFNDPILIRSGQKLTLTQKAKNIKEPLNEIIKKAEELFKNEKTNDLHEISREFIICANDIFFNKYAISIQKKISQKSPKSRIIFVPEDANPPDFLKNGKKIDLYIEATNSHKKDTKTQLLFTRKFIAIACQENEIFKEKITPLSFSSKDHILISRRLIINGPIDMELSSMGLSRKIKIVAPSYSAAVLILQNTDMILTAPEGVISNSTAELLKLRIFDIPLNLPEISIRQSWHLCDDNDYAHRWLRASIKKLCSQTT